MPYLKFLKSPKLQILIIILMTFLAYSNILQNDFLGDDRAFIQHWNFPSDIKNIPYAFTHRTNPPGLPLDYRPIMTTFLILGKSTWGESKLFFRLESILVHLFATVLVYFITAHLTREVKKMPASSEKLALRSERGEQLHLPGGAYVPFKSFSSQAPLITSLLFGLHPIHTEVVDYVMVSLDNVAVVFLFASFYFYIKSAGKLALVFATLAFFTYEIALILPFLLILYDFCFKKFKKNYIKNILLRLLPFILSAGAYLWIRAVLTTPGGDRGTYFLGSFYLNMIIMPKLIWKYVELLVLPLNLSFIHQITGGLETYPTPYSNISGIMKWSIFSPEVFLPGLALLSLLAICIWSYKKFPVITFCIGWFFISILPVANLIPIGVTFSERYAYLASFGFILVISYWLLVIGSKITNKKQYRLVFLLLSFYFLIFTFYFFQTYQRNFDWRNIESLAKSILRVNPESLIARYNLAGYYRGVDLDKAEAEYKILISFDPRVKEAHFDLGNVYLAQGRQDLAGIEFNKTLELDPDFMDAYIALGEINLSKGQLEAARKYFNRALDVNPKNYLLFQLPKSESEIALSRSRAAEGLRATYDKK